MNEDATPAQGTPEHGAGAGAATPAEEPWPAMVIGNEGYTEADGDAYWFSGIDWKLKHEVYSIGHHGEDFDYAVRTLSRFSTHPDPEVRAQVVMGAILLARRCGIVEDLREIFRRALKDEAPNVRSAGRWFEQEDKRFNFFTPEELAMQKKLPGLEFQLWLIRNDSVETEKLWHYHRIWAEEHKAEYAKMTKAERKRYRQQFIRNDSRNRQMFKRTKNPDAQKLRVQKAIFERAYNHQRRAWVPRWLP